jgi:hypothetical protein
MRSSQADKKLESLIKINKCLGIALAEITNTHSYIGSSREQQQLIAVKLKLEGIMERTLRAERGLKRSFFTRLK